MRIALARVTAILLIVIMAASGFGSNMVLCLGENGHVSIEPATKGRCCGETEDAHQDCREAPGDDTCFASGDGCCYRCIDIPLPTLPAADCRITKKSPTTRQSILAAVSSHTTCPDFFRIPGIWARLCPFGIPTFSRPGTTVVLRI